MMNEDLTEIPLNIIFCSSFSDWALNLVTYWIHLPD